MFTRFAAASAVAAIALGVAVTVAWIVVPAPQAVRLLPILRIWCLIPAVWGVWAMLTPRAWMPERLPWWGGILGLLLGILLGFVLNVPQQMLGEVVPVWPRATGLVLITAFYYLLWHLVRLAWLHLAERAR